MDYDITFPDSTITYTNAGGIILISILIVAAAIIMIRYSSGILSGIAGLVIYMIVCVTGVELVTAIVSFVPVISDIVLSGAAVFAFFRAVVFTALVQLSRWILIKFTDRKGDMQLGGALIGGWGIALGGAIVSGIDLLYIATLGNTINTYGLSELMADLSEEDITSLVESIQQVCDISPLYFLYKGINCASDVLFSIFIFVLLYAIVKKNLDKKWYIIITALTFGMYMCTLAYDYQLLDSYGILAALKVAVLVCTIVLSLNVDTNYLNGELRSFDKMKKKDKMPKYENNLKNK